MVDDKPKGLPWPVHVSKIQTFKITHLSHGLVIDCGMALEAEVEFEEVIGTPDNPEAISEAELEGEGIMIVAGLELEAALYGEIEIDTELESPGTYGIG